MLRSLDIRDMLIIDRLTLTLQPGLNVLTGETGAGKSILLDTLGFVLGWRGRADLVRPGAEHGEVVAEFDLAPGHPARAVLAEAGLESDGDLILRRQNGADGRKTAWVNDRRVSGEVLRALSETLVELHGQHDDRGLLNARGHRQLLDRFAGAEDAVAACRDAWSTRREAAKALARAEEQVAALKAEEEFLRHAVAELDRLGQTPGEEAELDARRRLMQSASRIREDIARAFAALGPDGAEGAMGDALRWLEGAADRAEGRLEEPVAALGRALAELSDAAQGVEACLDALAFNPSELELVEERLFEIRALARKHQVAPDDLGPLAADLGARLAALDAGEGDLARLRKALAAAQSGYYTAAAALSELRHEAAARLDAAVMTELGPLKLDRARFVTEITKAEAGPEGADTVAFAVATAPGAEPGPIARIASGGELSRFLLALKVSLADPDAGQTLIFDEIDRGVGGATADAVGRRLAALAEQGQVLVVTHSPQVAARGRSHWRVEKRIEAQTVTSAVVPLHPEERVEEIARMLAGENITAEARAAAAALLAG